MICVYTAVGPGDEHRVSALTDSLPDDVEHLIALDGASLDQLPNRSVTRASKIVTLGRSYGPAVAKNAALIYSTCPFVMPIDADDVMAPGAVELVANEVEIYGDELGWVAQGSAQREYRAKELDDYWPIRGNMWSPNVVVYRRLVVEQVGGYRALPVDEDLDLLLRASRVSAGAMVPSGLVIRTERRDSFSAEVLKDHGDLFNLARGWRRVDDKLRRETPGEREANERGNGRVRPARRW